MYAIRSYYDPLLTYLGTLVARKMLVHTVANRMQVHRDLTQHPEILNVV